MDPPIVRVFAATVMMRLPAPSNVTFPAPRFTDCVPAKVKSEPMSIALLFEFVIGEALLLSIVPPLMVKAPDPSADALLILRVPFVSVTPPVKVFEPERVMIDAAEVGFCVTDVGPLMTEFRLTGEPMVEALKIVPLMLMPPDETLMLPPALLG